MLASRKTRIAAVLLLLTAVTACSRRHESNDFLPSSPEFQRALQIVLAALSVPADGASTVRIEAQISPDADADKRTVRFETTLGSWVDPDPEATGGGNPNGGGGGGGGNTTPTGRTATREADSQGRAVAFLKAAKEAGVAVITVSVIDDQKNVLATVSGEVTFTQVTDALELRVSPAEVIADGKTEILLEAEISADSPADWKTIEFSTTRGSINGKTIASGDIASAAADVVADADRIARARLTSPTAGSATVTAKIDEFTSIAVNQFVTFTAPDISATPGSLDFGDVQVETSSDLQLTLGNHGSVPVSVTDWTISGTDAADFAVAVAPSRPVTIAPANSVQITVRFSPQTAGGKSADLKIMVNDMSEAILTVTLAGVGVTAPNIGVSPNPLEFGNVTENTTKDLPLTISNSGGAALEIGTLTFSNDKYSLVGSAPTSIAPGTSVPITVRFSPDAKVTENGVLNIPSNDPDSPVVAVTLTGTGTA